MRGRTNLLFNESLLSNVLRYNLEQVSVEVDRITEGMFLTNDDQTIFDHLFSKMEVLPLELYEDHKEIEKCETQIDARDYPARYVSDESRPCMIPGLEITITIPFTGDTVLWKSQPSTFNICPPRAQIENNSSNDNSGLVKLVFTQPTDTLGDGSVIKNGINKLLEDIRLWLGYSRKDVEAHNKELQGAIKSAISARRQRLGVHDKVLEALDIPLKKNPKAPDVKLLPISKKIIKPLASGPNVSPEPGISREVYEDILSIIRHEGRTFETTPKTYAKLDEEELRDIIVANLNGFYKGAATGETFRKAGKTDIRIEDNSRAAFVAECKIWKGEKTLLDAVDQLLGYLTWRDCKTSLIFFNKTIAGFAEIQEKLPTIMKTHLSFLKDKSSQEHGEWRYIFKSKDDEDRPITVHVFMFNLYVKK